MNPTPGSAVTNAGFTDTADIPGAIDAFGTSRPQGIAWDGGAVEIIAGTTVSRDFVCSIDSQQSLPSIPNDDPVFGIEWRHAKTIDFVAPIAWTAGAGSSFGSASDAQIPLEFLHAKTIDSGSQIEWGASVIPTQRSDAAIGIEWGVGRQRDFAVSLGSLQGLATDVSAPNEWGSVTFSTGVNAQMSLEILQSTPSLLGPWGQMFGPVFGIGPYSTDPRFAIEWSVNLTLQTPLSADASFNLDILQNAQNTDVAFPIEFGGGVGSGLTTNWTVPIEWRAPVQVDASASLETNVLVARDAGMQAEWGATTSFSVNAAFVVDWRASVVADSGGPIAWLKALAVPVNMAAGMEWRTGVAMDFSAASDLRASVLTDSAGLVAWAQPVTAGSATIPIGISRSVMADGPTQVVTLATIQRDLPSLLEWNITIAIPANFSIPIEFAASVAADKTGATAWTASIIANSAAPLASAASLAADGRLAMEVLRGVQADAVAPTAPGGGVAGTIGAPLEFGHLTFTIMVDGTAPLEINSLVVGGIVVPVEPGAVHLTLGAKLEPDTWEFQNQPETGGQLP
jgi:hypothetical protein